MDRCSICLEDAFTSVKAARNKRPQRKNPQLPVKTRKEIQMSLTNKVQPLLTILTASFLWIVPQLTWAQEGPWNALTQPAVQEVIATIASSRAQAQLDASANGITGRYAVAATYNLAYLQDAEQQFEELDAWLASNGLYTPFVDNASAAYNIHGTVREVSSLLHHARH
jgi:hypothetical protein